MAGQSAQLRTGGGVPQPHRAVAASGGEDRPVRGERDRGLRCGRRPRHRLRGIPPGDRRRGQLRRARGRAEPPTENRRPPPPATRQHRPGQVRVDETGTTKVRTGQVHPGKLDAGHPRTPHRRAGQVGPTQHPTDDLDAVKIGRPAHHPLGPDITQGRPGQARLGQVRAVERGRGQGRAGEHRRPQVGAVQVGAVEPGVGEVRPPQVRAAQVPAGEVLPGEIGVGELRPRPQPDAQPARDQIRVRLRHRRRVRVVDGVLRPAGRLNPAGQIGEEVGHQL